MGAQHDGEQPGLEHVAIDNYPEVVVPENEPPQAVPHQSGQEPWQQKPSGTNVPTEPYAEKNAPPDTQLPTYSAHHELGGQNVQSDPPPARVCGLKRKTFFILCAVAVLIAVVLAAVLGGVLGSRHSS